MSSACDDFDSDHNLDQYLSEIYNESNIMNRNCKPNSLYKNLEKADFRMLKAMKKQKQNSPSKVYEEMIQSRDETIARCKEMIQQREESIDAFQRLNNNQADQIQGLEQINDVQTKTMKKIQESNDMQNEIMRKLQESNEALKRTITELQQTILQQKEELESSPIIPPGGMSISA